MALLLFCLPTQMHLQIFFPPSKLPKNKSTACSCIKRRPEPSALSVSLVVTPSPWGTRCPLLFCPLNVPFLFSSPISNPLPSTWLKLYLTSKPPLLLLYWKSWSFFDKKKTTKKGTTRIVVAVAAAASLVVFSGILERREGNTHTHIRFADFFSRARDQSHSSRPLRVINYTDHLTLPSQGYIFF